MARLLEKYFQYLKTGRIEDLPGPPQGQYSFCEGIAAGSASRWHIRKLSPQGQKIGGGADTPSLCGRKMAWDLKPPITPRILQDSTAVCRECARHYYDREDA